MPVTPPNFTQIPNELLDKMSDMSPAEFKVLMAICRKTFGWHKRRDVISLSQLEEMTGLSRSAVQAGIMAGIERGMLERKPVGKQSFSYQLVVSDYQSTETTSSKKLPGLVASDYQELVASDYSQKKEINKGNKGGGVERTNDAAAAMKLLGMTGKQRRDILQAHPELTPAEVTAWQAFRDTPPSWCSKPEAYIYRRLMDGDPAPMDQSEPDEEPVEQPIWNDDGTVTVPESVRRRLEADRKKEYLYHRG